MTASPEPVVAAVQLVWTVVAATSTCAAIWLTGRPCRPSLESVACSPRRSKDGRPWYGDREPLRSRLPTQ